MKKMIIVLCFLAVVFAVGIAEIFVTSGIFGGVYDRLIGIEKIMEKTPKQLDSPEIIKEVGDCLDYWEKNRTYLFIVNNHTIMRNLDEKLVTLKKQVEINADQDAPVTLSIAKNYALELKEDTFPKVVNLF